RDAVDGDAEGAEVDGAGAGQTQQRRLGGRVHVALLLGQKAHDRRDVNDAAPAPLLHLRHQGARKGHHGGQVQLDDLVPGGVVDLVNGLRLVAAGVVDEDIDAAHLIEGGFRQAFDVVALAHVGDDVLALAPGAGENLLDG